MEWWGHSGMLAAAKDPYFANVSLLLQPVEGGSIIDLSPSPKTITAFGNAQISTSQSAFSGGASIAFDGNGDYLSVPRSTAFLPVANEDFTLEALVYLRATPGATDACIMGFGEYGTDSDWVIAIDSSRQAYFYANSAVTAYLNTSALVPLNAWTYIAASRSGTGSNNLKVGVGGAVQSFTSNATTVATGNRNLTIGADQNGDESNLTGNIGIVRITKGIGRDISVVPTAPFPNS